MKIGSKIKRLRLQRGLTQEELADRCELSKGFISLLERDLTSPSIATLVDVLECLGTDLPQFFSAKKTLGKWFFSVADTSVKVDEEGLKGFIPLAGARAPRKTAWSRSWLKSGRGRNGRGRPPRGEEFGYVLSGSVQSSAGDRTNDARPQG
jgi:transcriptional regulator with XRE-family HTH domain